MGSELLREGSPPRPWVLRVGRINAVQILAAIGVLTPLQLIQQEDRIITNTMNQLAKFHRAPASEQQGILAAHGAQTVLAGYATNHSRHPTFTKLINHLFASILQSCEMEFRQMTAVRKLITGTSDISSSTLLVEKLETKVLSQHIQWLTDIIQLTEGYLRNIIGVDPQLEAEAAKWVVYARQLRGMFYFGR